MQLNFDIEINLANLDLRFLSIDFLNTFLLTYRVFTDGETVLNALKKVFYDPPAESDPSLDTGEHHTADYLDIPGTHFDDPLSPRRTSGASSVSGKYKCYLKRELKCHIHFI